MRVLKNFLCHCIDFELSELQEKNTLNATTEQSQLQKDQAAH